MELFDESLYSFKWDCFCSCMLFIDGMSSRSLIGALSVVLFGKHLFAASSLVLIFSKKIGFSLGKVGKVADSVQNSYKLVFTLFVIQCVSF